jgi:C-terminal processing protease CtpA/Prc
LRTPDGTIKQVETVAEFHPNKTTGWMAWDDNDIERQEQEHRPRIIERGHSAIIYKLSDFVFDPDSANAMLDQIRSHDALVLDLRGNPGGIVDFEGRFLGGMFDHDVKIGDRVGRKPMKAQFTKSRGGKTFNGKLVVLIDSRSASAAELFARVVQLEHRGIVVGDRSSGAVMESRIYPHQAETFGGAFDYAVSIAEANIIMQDGKSLEKVGVMPDYRIVPTPADLAEDVIRPLPTPLRKLASCSRQKKLESFSLIFGQKKIERFVLNNIVL